MKKKILIFILLTIAAFCGVWFGLAYVEAESEAQANEALAQTYTTVIEMPGHAGSGAESAEAPPPFGLPYVQPDFDALLSANPETIGWLHIPDTVISCPVLQTKNNSKYLSTAFDGTRSNAGAVFMETKNSPYPLDRNTILYGHHLKGRNVAFGSLLDYKAPEFYASHRFIQFDSIHHTYGWWEVFAVIHLDVKNSEFNYLQLSFNSHAEFFDWIDKAKSLSIHESDVAIKEDDKILTLSTCDRGDGFGRNGRFIVMAKHYTYYNQGA